VTREAFLERLALTWKGATAEASALEHVAARIDEMLTDPEILAAALQAAAEGFAKDAMRLHDLAAAVRRGLE
jgi:hypothetical protein